MSIMAVGTTEAGRALPQLYPKPGFFQDFLLGPFLQRRLSLAEQLGWNSGGGGGGGVLTPVLNKCS